MKCPYCDYIDGEFNEDFTEVITGSKGRFFSLSGLGMMCRPDEYSYNRETECKELHACPNCGKTFIEV